MSQSPTGIILSISIITALSVAVLETPQIQTWLESQRQKLIELLRQIGEELDPQSRRAAEAFAYEGRTPATDAGLRREASGSLEAAAVATGRSLGDSGSVRRVPTVRGPSDGVEAEERRRKGREYLAKRNQEMWEMKERRKGSRLEKGEAGSGGWTPTSFDSMVDSDGKLRESEIDKGKEREMPTFPGLDDVSAQMNDRMEGVERELLQPLLAGESSSTNPWRLDSSQLSNPFGDEHALDRSETPKPPVPPKVALPVEEDEVSAIPTMPGSFPPRRPEEPQPRYEHEEQQEEEELSYEEQLAIALSLSEAEAQKAARAAIAQIEPLEDDDADLRAAIEASLNDMSRKLAAQAEEERRQKLRGPEPEPLVDLTPPSPPPRPRALYQPAPQRGHWETVFDQDYSPTREPLSMVSPRPIAVDEDDELYNTTPRLARAGVVAPSNSNSNSNSTRFEHLLTQPEIDAAECYTTTSPPPAGNVDRNTTQGGSFQQQLLAAMEASFYSATSSAAPSPSPATTHTMLHSPFSPPQQQRNELIDTSAPAPATPAHGEAPSRTLSQASFSFHTDHDSNSNTDSDSETFASISAPASRESRTQSRDLSRARSSVSEDDVEVVDLAEEDDSDVDLLSGEEGEGMGMGIATPDSWTEVGSDSEMEEEGRHPNRRFVEL